MYAVEPNSEATFFIELPDVIPRGRQKAAAETPENDMPSYGTNEEEDGCHAKHIC